MTKTSAVMLASLTLLAIGVLTCGAIVLAVREGALPEIQVWLPPRTRYQVIVRVGQDTMPWRQWGSREVAINIWVYGRMTSWHIINLLHIPLGQVTEIAGVHRAIP